MAENELNSAESTLAGESEKYEPPKIDEVSLSGASQGRITELEKALAESEKKLTDISDALSQAIASYKAIIVKSNPGIIEELITGNTIEEINASLEKARTIVIKVKKGLEEEVASTRVPSGAPQRKLIDLSSLSPREKIQYAIGGKK